MRSIRLQIEDLERSVYALVHLGDGDIYVNMEDVIHLNKEIRKGIEALYPVEVSDVNEEASLCAVLLAAYGELMCQDSRDEKRRQMILNRSARLLVKLPPSLLKCRLLVYCYSEVPEPELAREIHSIMTGWQERELSPEEQDLTDMFRVLEEYNR